MKTSPDNFRQALLDRTLALLWHQWTLLGIPGHQGTGDEDRIIDPESLLLLTSGVARFDPRLLDEVTNWLRRYGRLVNIQRLKGISGQYAFGNPRVLAALAATVLQNSRLAKWHAIEALAEPRTGDEPLFRNTDGSPMPVFGKPDPFYKKFGYFRSPQKFRDDTSPPQVKSPALLLVKLRALFGVNARAEIIAALLTTPSAHPSALARLTAYLPRSVQDTLNEMALSGHVLSARSKGSREKFFSLRPEDWDFLLARPDTRFPTWTNWPIHFSLLHDVLQALMEGKQTSRMAMALRFREIFDRHYPALVEAGLAGPLSGVAQESGLEFLETFLTRITHL